MIDGPAHGVVRSNGDVEVIFERAKLLDGQVTERGVYRMRSTDGGRSFSVPVALRDEPGIDERDPSVIETSGGVLYCYFESNRGGTTSIHVGQSIDGDTWSLPPLPLDLGQSPGDPVGAPAAALHPDGGAVLAYENRADGGVHVIRLPNYLAPDAPVLATHLAPGVEPAILAKQFGRLVVAFRSLPPDAGIGLSVSPDGTGWASQPVSYPGRAFGSPHLAELPSGLTVLHVDEETVAGTHRILRALSVQAGVPPLFGPAVELPLGADAMLPLALPDDPGQPDRLAAYCAVADLASPPSAHLARSALDDCDELPAFDGLEQVVDEEPCASSGLLLSWSPATSWGSAPTGSYLVYRSEDPAFLPGPSTLLAATGDTTWLDATVEPGIVYWYVVEAVGDETCALLATGEVGGLAQGTGVRRSGVDRDSAVAPDEVAGLRISRVDAASFVLSWQDVPSAVGYLVSGSAAADPGSFTDLTPGPELGPLRIDPAPGPWAGDLFVLVRAVDECGTQGPATGEISAGG